jgi:hypothetical protein
MGERSLEIEHLVDCSCQELLGKLLYHALATRRYKVVDLAHRR